MTGGAYLLIFCSIVFLSIFFYTGIHFEGETNESKTSYLGRHCFYIHSWYPFCD